MDLVDFGEYYLYARQVYILYAFHVNLCSLASANAEAAA